MALPAGLVAPNYGGGCLDGLLPALVQPPRDRPDWLPRPLQSARQVLVFVIDGLGWLQLMERQQLAPTVCALEGGPITTVAPTTTATALSSLAVGAPPAVHGIIGYKFAVEGPSGKEVLNVLRWATSSGDARPFFPPAKAQPCPAFAGRSVPVVSRANFAGSGFTEAHQRGGRQHGWVVPSSVPVIATHLLHQGEQLVYAYYDGLDKVAHAEGFGELYDAELRAVDRMVAEMLAELPDGAALAVTADHGQVDVGGRAVPIEPSVAEAAQLFSGEGRFRWLHAAPGLEEALAERAQRSYGRDAWVASREEALQSGIFGGYPSDEVLARLGDVLVVPLGNQAYLDPGDKNEAKLVCRHGGLSPAEVFVPLLAA